MDEKTCCERLEQYLKKDSYAPRFVNVKSAEALDAISQHFRVPGNVFLSVQELAKKDELPQIDRLQNELSRRTGNLFITGLSTFLRFQGAAELRRRIRAFSLGSYAAKVVFLFVDAGNYLAKDDPKTGHLFLDVGSADDAAPMPTLVFTADKEFIPADAPYVSGIENSIEKAEHMHGGELYVLTKHRSSEYSSAMLPIREMAGAFSVLASRDSMAQELCEEWGTEENWRGLLSLVQKEGALLNVFTNRFTSLKALDGSLVRWQHFTDFEKWLYFLAGKLAHGDVRSWSLAAAFAKAGRAADIPQALYDSLLSLAPTAADFWEKYKERRQRIGELAEPDALASSYMNLVAAKGRDGLYYLSDRTKVERNKIFELLDAYRDAYSEEEVRTVLSHIYPALSEYLQPYQFDGKWGEYLTAYFEEYKYQKVTNSIHPSFLEKVEEQAVKREYNANLLPRMQIVDGLDREDAKLYFVDAMGVEYLSFVRARCRALGLMADIAVARSELPSLTCFNKDFVGEFSDVVNFKTLDEMKHGGKEDLDYPNYENTKLPLHLSHELSVIESVLKNIDEKLRANECAQAYMISDHGASRLAVIHEHENQWEMEERGEHSGRCCKVSEADVQSPYATESNGYWVLANYDRFRGSRKASVEVHGGATLEEITVPIIRVTRMPADISLTVTSKLPLVVSFKDKAALEFAANQPLANVSVSVTGGRLAGKAYAAEATSKQSWKVAMPDVKQAGEYTMTVYMGGNEIGKLTFTVKKKGMSESNMGL